MWYIFIFAAIMTFLIKGGIVHRIIAVAAIGIFIFFNRRRFIRIWYKLKYIRNDCVCQHCGRVNRKWVEKKELRKELMEIMMSENLYTLYYMEERDDCVCEHCGEENHKWIKNSRYVKNTIFGYSDNKDDEYSIIVTFMSCAKCGKNKPAHTIHKRYGNGRRNYRKNIIKPESCEKNYAQNNSKRK